MTPRTKVRISNQVRLDPVNPIPIDHGGKALTYAKGEKYIPFLHPKDDFFKVILEANLLSNTNRLCIRSKAIFAAGAGIWMLDGGNVPKALEVFLKSMNNRGENDIRISRKLFSRLFTFGNVPVEMVRMKVAGKPIFRVFVHNPTEWRLSWPDNTEGIPKSAIFSKLFLREGILSIEQLDKARTIPLYQHNALERDRWVRMPDGSERSMLWIKTDDESHPDYGMPSNVSSLIYQILEYKAARFNLDNIENNMVVGGILALKGNLSVKECQRIAREIITTHTGDGKRGRVAVIASEDGIADSTFHQHNVNHDGSYLDLDERMTTKIIVANEWHEMLMGIERKNGMGNGNSYLYAVYELKKKTVIDPSQQAMIADFWDIILPIAGQWLGNKEITEAQVTYNDLDPVSILHTIDPAPAVKVNELRDSVGLPMDETPYGNQYMKTMGQQERKEAKDDTA